MQASWWEIIAIAWTAIAFHCALTDICECQDPRTVKMTEWCMTVRGMMNTSKNPFFLCAYQFSTAVGCLLGSFILWPIALIRLAIRQTYVSDTALIRRLRTYTLLEEAERVPEDTTEPPTPWTSKQEAAGEFKEHADMDLAGIRSSIYAIDAPPANLPVDKQPVDKNAVTERLPVIPDPDKKVPEDPTTAPTERLPKT